MQGLDVYADLRLKTSMSITDVLIIGAGPVGLFAIHQCGTLGLSVQVVDSLPEIGGQCTALYPEKPIYDIPAYPEISAGDLIHQLEKQASSFNPSYHLGYAVVALNKVGEHWHILTEDGASFQARTVLIAAGAGAFGPNRPPLEGIESYEGASIFYMVRHRDDFRDKRILIAGGGDSAVDWALSLSDIAAHIGIIHRRDKFRAAPESVARLHDLAEQGKIQMYVPYQLKALEGSNGELSHVILSHLKGSEDLKIETDVLLPFYGLAAELGPIKEWGLELDGQTIKVDHTTASTNVDGIFAIGDVASYPHKLKLILTGFADAAQAAHAIRTYIYPKKVFHFEYSTTKGIPSA